MSLLDIVTSSLTECLPGPGERLPSLRELAARLGTNKDTVARAVKVLIDRKVLEKGRLRRGFCRCGGQDAQSPSLASPPHQGLEQRLCREFLVGHYEAGSQIPPAKVLLDRLGGSRRALRTAMHSLACRGVVRRRGAWYVAEAYAVPRKGAHVFLAGSPRTLLPVRTGTQEFVVPLELELGRCGWGSLRYFLSDSPANSRGPRPHEVAGFVAPRIAEAKRWAAYLNSHPSIPLVAFDAYETMHWGPDRFRRHRALYPIMLDNRSAGRDTTRHVLSRGFRRVVFLSHLAPATDPAARPWRNWLSNRLAGIGEAAREIDGARLTVRFIETDASLGGSGIAGTTPLPRMQVLLIPAAARDLAANACETVAHIHGIGVALKTVFEESLVRDKADAWICVNDQCAAAALSFLERKRAQGDVAIFSFDNAPLSYALGISSYDFLVPWAGALAARCLVTPSAAIKDSDGYLRVRGRLVTR